MWLIFLAGCWVCKDGLMSGSHIYLFPTSIAWFLDSCILPVETENHIMVMIRNTRLILFPIAAIKNYQTEWLKPTQIHYTVVLEVTSLKWASLGSNQGIARASFFLKGRSVIWIFQHLEAPACLGPFRHLQNQQCSIISSLSGSHPCFVVTSPFLPLLPLSFTNRDSCDYIEPTWIMQDNLPFSRSLLPHKVS